MEEWKGCKGSKDENIIKRFMISEINVKNITESFINLSTYWTSKIMNI